MSAFLLIESRSATEAPEVRGFLEMAAQLGSDGHEVDLFLIQNGVLLAAGGAEPGLEALVDCRNIRVWADGFSLEARALDSSELATGIRVAQMQDLIGMLTSGTRNPVWH